MFLAYAIYNKKYIIILVLGKSGDKTLALKVQEPPRSPIMSDKSINSIRSSINKLTKLGVQDRIARIKHIIQEFKQVYRTYDTNKLNIIQKFGIGPL